METSIEQIKTPVVANPFGDAATDERLAPGAVAIESERAIAEVKAAIAMARMYPRNKHAAMEKILETCRRIDFAKTALYRYPRGSQQVEGLTIRAAEVIANAWGNISAGLFELSQAEGESEWMARAWDLETNTGYQRSFRFKHERHTGNGVQKLKDPRDIYELGANYGQRRLRALILEVIDQDVIAAATAQVKATVAASVTGKGGKTLPEKRDELVKQFGLVNIKVKSLETYLEHSIADMTPEEYADLGTIFVALKEGHGNAHDYFKDIPKGTAVSEKAAELDAKLGGKNGETCGALIES